MEEIDLVLSLQLSRSFLLGLPGLTVKSFRQLNIIHSLVPSRGSLVDKLLILFAEHIHTLFSYYVASKELTG